MRLPALTVAAALWAFYRLWEAPGELSRTDLAVIALGLAASGALGSSSRGRGRMGSRVRRWVDAMGERLLGAARRWPWGTVAAVAAIAWAARGVYRPLEDLDRFVRSGDWPVNAVFARTAYEAIARGRPLTWATEISAGEAIFDLYPTFVHRVLAWVAYALGDVRLIVPLMSASAVLACVAVAIGAARAAIRLGAPWPAAAIAGLAVVLDSGSDFSWGMRSTFRWGFFPSTCAIAVVMFTLPAVLALAERRGSVWRVALGIGLAAIMHPVGIVLAAALLAGTALAWMLRRGGAALGPARVLVALGLGVALTAPIWAPASARIVAYGVHYATPVLVLHDAITRMRRGTLPDGDFGALVVLGWAVCAVSLFDRDPRRRIVAGAAFFLFALYVDTLFVDFGLAPSSVSVRWQAYRVGTYVKPLLYVMGAVGIGALAHLPPILRDARLVVIARLALLALTLQLAYASPSFETALGAALATPHERRPAVRPTEPGSDEDIDRVVRVLVQERAAIAEPHARVLMWCPTGCRYRMLEALRAAGLSTLVTHAAPAGFFSRDQFHTATPENLRRFGVRWIVGTQTQPPPSPRPVREELGEFRIADNPTWDGEIAHVVRGSPGVVHTRVVPGEGFDLTLEGAPSALVELGTPYYPRLRATHAGQDVPIEAMLVDGPTHEHAVRLRIEQGVTQVRADGSLPSDRAGWPLAGIALAGIALTFARRRPRAERLRALLDRALPLARRWARPAAWAGVVLVPAVLVLATGEWTGRARSVRFGPLFPPARIALESYDGRWGECVPIDQGRRRRCSDGTVIEMSLDARISDWQVGWPSPAPGISVRSDHSVHLSIAMPIRLEGDYYGVCAGCTADLDLPGGARQRLEGATTRLHLPRISPVHLEMRAEPDACLSIIDAAVLDPPFAYPLAPAR